MKASVIASLGFASAVLGHATFQQLWVDGVDQKSTCARLPLSNSPVEKVSSNAMRCNAGTSPVAGICAVPAGSKIAVEMHEQPNDRTCSRPAIGGNHYGPVMVYLSKVQDATKDDGSGSWFKIAEMGYDGSKWGTDKLNANCGKYEVTIPSSVAPGDYLVRAEAIALHAAQSEGGAQFYMTCYQIHVSGSGSATPQGVKFPGAYSATDPGIKIDIWGSKFEPYQIPGPDPITN